MVEQLPARIAIALIGDVEQLPSVSPGCVLRDLIDSDRVSLQFG